MSGGERNEDTLRVALSSATEDLREVLEAARRRFEDNEMSACL